MTGIERTPTEAERGEMVVLGEVTPFKVFLAELAKVGQEFLKKKVPFDEQCAKVDYQDEVDRLTKENERTYGFVREEDIRKIKVNFKVYGKEDRFELIEDDEEIEMQNINNVKTPVKVGHTIKYKCKARGHGISVFMPTGIYEERFGVKEKKVEKEE